MILRGQLIVVLDHVGTRNKTLPTMEDVKSLSDTEGFVVAGFFKLKTIAAPGGVKSGGPQGTRPG